MLERLLRKLARQHYWQTYYTRAKELNLSLFNNDRDLTPVQTEFLQWLEVYNSLYGDLYSFKDGLDDKVINDDFLCDGYLIWERREREAEAKPQNRNKKKQAIDKKADESARATGIPRISFT